MISTTEVLSSPRHKVRVGNNHMWGVGLEKLDRIPSGAQAPVSHYKHKDNDGDEPDVQNMLK